MYYVCKSLYIYYAQCVEDTKTDVVTPQIQWTCMYDQYNYAKANCIILYGIRLYTSHMTIATLIKPTNVSNNIILMHEWSFQHQLTANLCNPCMSI